VSVCCVLAGCKVLGREEQALHVLQDLLITMVGDVQKKQWGSMAGGEEWRRPWRRAHVPGEGSANMSGWDAHEHRGGVGVRLPYLIWPEVGRKEVVDGGTAWVFTGGDGGTVFCLLGCHRVVKKLLGSFYGLMWCCWCPWLG
jgi:hypothetical protein